MTSKNNGEQEGKADFGILFDDFPNCHNGTLIELAIREDWQRLLDECVSVVGWKEVYRVRLYGVEKYARYNWRESRGTDEHANFMAANKRSIYRHLIESETDPESGCHPLAHVALRCMIAIEYALSEDEEADTFYTRDENGELKEKKPDTFDAHRTTRNTLKRGDEMPDWLVELIEERTDERVEHESWVIDRFTWYATNESKEFWKSVFEWQRGKGELPKRPTLYDWSDPDIPEWATHIATDKTGIVFAYEVIDGVILTPSEGDDWVNDGDKQMRFEELKDYRPDLSENWRDSLEARPTERKEAGE